MSAAHGTARVYPSGTSEDPARIEAVLGRAGAGAVAHVHPAWGSAAPEREATVSGSARIVCGVDGCNDMHVPQGSAVQRLALQPGEVVVIARHAWNRPLHLQAKTFLVVDCARDHIRYYLSRRDGPGSVPRQAWLAWVERPASATTWQLYSAMETLLAEADAQAVLRAACTAYLRQCLRELHQGDDCRQDRTWLHLRSWVEEHLHEGIDRGAAARACGVHPNHVSRLFRRHADRGFAAWCTERRMERACELLVRPDLPVAAVAARCGYAGAGHFAQVFRRHQGLSPSAWRQQARLSRGDDR